MRIINYEFKIKMLKLLKKNSSDRTGIINNNYVSKTLERLTGKNIYISDERSKTKFAFITFFPISIQPRKKKTESIL